jgi:hypothetical protein
MQERGHRLHDMHVSQEVCFVGVVHHVRRVFRFKHCLKCFSGLQPEKQIVCSPCMQPLPHVHVSFWSFVCLCLLAYLRPAGLSACRPAVKHCLSDLLNPSSSPSCCCCPCPCPPPPPLHTPAPVLPHLSGCGSAVSALASRATQLRSLSLSRYDLASVTCVTGASQLTSLALQCCSLQDSGLKGLGRLTKLRRLDLSDNNVTAGGLQELSSLQGLVRGGTWGGWGVMGRCGGLCACKGVRTE